MTVTKSMVSIYRFEFTFSTLVFTEDELIERLDKLAKVDKETHWIKYDLSLSSSSCLGRFFWIFAQYCQGLRSLFYCINHNKAKKLLVQLGRILEKDGNDRIKNAFAQAVNKFNYIVSPEHQVIPDKEFSQNRVDIPDHVEVEDTGSMTNKSGRIINYLKYSTGYLSSFYKGEVTDFYGRQLIDLQNLSNDYSSIGNNKESEHWFIQWLFPLKKPSKAQERAWGPVLTDAQINALKKDSKIIQNFRISLEQMLIFYGLKYNKDKKLIEKREKSEQFSFEVQAKNWLGKENHNHPRLDRMLKCLLLFGMNEEADVLFKGLMSLKKEFPNSISDHTIKVWSNTMKGIDEDF